MIDFHTHILPAIDDGSRNLEESLEILYRQQEAGIEIIIATPHFYPNQTIETFIKARKDALETLEEEIQKRKLHLRLGAEVLLSVDTWKLEGLEALCIEGTHYILVELPYSYWSDWVYASVEKLIIAKGLTPILAHVERYDAVEEEPNRLLPFLEMGCILQANTISFHQESSKRKLALKLVKHGFIQLLGSDVHRSKGLYPVSMGYNILKEKLGKTYLDNMQLIETKILENQKVSIENIKPFKKILGKWY